MTVAGRTERTRERLVAAALRLFEKEGYDTVSVARISAEAGVTEMTFFRHFPSKDRVLLDDPYDPLIVEAIRVQPSTTAPFRRVVRGLRDAWAAIPEPDEEIVRRRMAIAAGTPSLRAAMWRNMAVSEAAIVDLLVSEGAEAAEARVAAASALAGIMAALMEWSQTRNGAMGDAIREALDILDTTS